MRMATPGHARLSWVGASPGLRLMRGLPGTTNCLLRARVSASFPRLALPGATSTGEPAWRWQAVGAGRGTGRGAGGRQGRGGGLPSASLTLPARVGVGDDAALEVRTYPTFTSSLEALADWLQAEGVTQAVMEATGQDWKPCW